MFKKFIVFLCVFALTISQFVPANTSAKDDKTAPLFKISTPINGQTNVARNVKITLKFSENIYYGKYRNKIKLSTSNKSVTIKHNISNNCLTINHSYLLKYSLNYVITIPAYTIVDKAGNALKKNLTIKFKIRTNPSLATPPPLPQWDMWYAEGQIYEINGQEYLCIQSCTANNDHPVDFSCFVLLTDFYRPLDSVTTYFSVSESVNTSTLGYTMTSGQITGLPSKTTGIQRLEYDVTPLIDNVNGAIYLAGSNNAVSGIDDFAMSVRLNDTGTFDCFNGTSSSSDQTVSYTADTKYHIVLVANMDLHTYSVWVTPYGGIEKQIAQNYAFKTTSVSTDNLGKVLFLSEAGGDLEFENVIRRSVFSDGAVYSSIGENDGWQDNGLFLGYNNTNTVIINYDCTPLMNNVDASVDFADSDIQVRGLPNLCMFIRLNETGTFDVRNGLNNNSIMADIPVAYTSNTKYHLRVVADMAAKTYSVWVTPSGGSETKIANNYGFISSATDADDCGQVFIISAWENDRLIMENLTIG